MKKIVQNSSMLFIGMSLFFCILTFNYSISQATETKNMTEQSTNPKVKITTSLGDITVELNAEKAPKTTANFLQYVNDGFYVGTIFHRVINGFMVQGGGLDENMSNKPNNAPIENEADNGLSNDIGTIAMARTSDPHSATSQFFINVNDNTFLNHTQKTPQGWGYTVFGKVIKGMDVVNKIKEVATGNHQGYQDVPKEIIKITAVELVQ